MAAATALLIAGLIAPSVASAHAEGIISYRFPLPIWLYALGGALAVLTSVPAAILATPRPDRVGRDIYPSVRSLHLGAIGTTVATVTLAIVIFGGYAGEDNFRANPATIVIWVDMWVGVGVVSALVANVWDFTSPLTAAALELDRVLARRGVETRSYPEWLGCWPAVILLLIWAWLELCWPSGSEPVVVATLIVIYLDVQLVGCALFGAETWLARGELFTVFARTMARVAPLELYRLGSALPCPAQLCPGDDGSERVGCVACWRAGDPEHRGLRLRRYGAGVHREAALLPGGAVFVVCLLATVVFDGFSQTNRWYDLVGWITTNGPEFIANEHTGTLIRSIGMLIISGSFALFYLVACAIVAHFERRTPAATASRYAPALIPISAAYFIAHYATYLILYGQFTWKVLIDPLETDWVPDLNIWAGIPGGLVWAIQVGLIVAGHVLAVFEAHRIARTTATPSHSESRIARSHAALTALMIGYTGTGLWILAESIRAYTPG